MRYTSLWKLRRFARPFLWVVIIGVPLMIVNGWVEPNAMDRTRPVFEGLLSGLDVQVGGEADRAWDLLMDRTVHLALFLIGAALMTAISFYIGEWISQRLLLSLREALFDRLQTLSLRFFEGQRSGELISRINHDTAVLQRVLGQNFGRLIVAPFSVAFGVQKMLQISPILTLVLAGVIPIIVLTTHLLGARVRRYGRVVQEKMADLTAVISETVQGVRVIKVFGLEEMAKGRFETENVSVLANEMRSMRMRALNIIVLGTLTAGVASCTLMLGAREIRIQHASAADLMGFMVLMQLAASRVGYLSRVGLQLQLAEAAATRMLEILSKEPDLTEAQDAVAIDDLRGAISLENVTFAYDKEPVLKNINLHIAAGEVVALAGPSGSGKTTVANLVARLYDVDHGRISIDGVDLRKIKFDSLKRNMGIVPQETVLFSTSIQENIGYGRPDAGHDQIISAAEAASAHQFISQLPDGYETQVGERGAKLSGGQKQRIAIARALLRDPVILILDEATSSLDTESEAAIHRALQTLVKGRTTIIIAHRLSTIQNADRIVVLDRGEIVELGTHDELMASSGMYRRLYETGDLLSHDSDDPKSEPTPAGENAQDHTQREEAE